MTMDWTLCDCKPCEERRQSARQCCLAPNDCKWGGAGSCGSYRDAMELSRQDLDLLTRQGAGEAAGAETESVEMAVGAASKAWNKAVKYANETPALLSFLYDLDLMPEQVAPKTHAAWRMYVAIQAWMVATTLRAEGETPASGAP